MTFPEEHAAICKILWERDSPCVVELGAHDGSDTEWMLAASKHPNIFAIEADLINFHSLISKMLPILAVYGAIAGHSGICDFWGSRSSGGGYGSIYRPMNGLSVPADEFTGIGPVPCYTFDDFCNNHAIGQIDLLYVDIHGAERDMIEHGRAAIGRTRYLFMEVFNYSAYQNMATRDQLLAMLPGWTLMQEFPWNVLLKNGAYSETVRTNAFASRA
jgi:FkbM family methyltransferase